MELVIIAAGSGLMFLAGVADKKKRKMWLKNNDRSTTISSGKFVN